MFQWNCLWSSIFLNPVSPISLLLYIFMQEDEFLFPIQFIQIPFFTCVFILVLFELKRWEWKWFVFFCKRVVNKFLSWRFCENLALIGQNFYMWGQQWFKNFVTILLFPISEAVNDSTLSMLINFRTYESVSLTTKKSKYIFVHYNWFEPSFL